jgi:CRP-like cAMP-binding protein
VTILGITDGLPRRTLAAGETLIADGSRTDTLFVLLEGRLRVEKQGTRIAIVQDVGACVGEMSLLLDREATSDVVAESDAVVAVVERARALLTEQSDLALAIARLLASRLQVMTTYLVDLKRQYADHEGGLGMVDVVLGTLAQGGGGTTLGSDRDPDPEF